MTDLVWADPDSVRQYLDPNPSGPRETPVTLLHDHGFCARTCPSIHPPTRLYVMVLNAQVRLGFNASTRGAGYMYGEVREGHAHVIQPANYTGICTVIKYNQQTILGYALS